MSSNGHLKNLESYLHNKQSHNFKPLEKGIAGAMSGCVTRTLIQPLDVLKIRFQVQSEPTFGKGGGLYKGVFQALHVIIKQEGLKALWKGHIPAQFLSVTYGIGQFSSYTFAVQVFNDFMYKGSLIYAWSGAFAGLCGTLVSLPCDVARTRIIIQGYPLLYKGVLDSWKQIILTEGIRSLWKGFFPTLMMVVPQTAVQMYLYQVLYPFVSKKLQNDNAVSKMISSSLVSGSIAGIGAKMAVHPLDVLKKRLQIMGFEHARAKLGKVTVWKSVWDCICKTSSEGMMPWLKGMSPSLLKAGISTALYFTMFEVACHTILVLKTS